MFKEIIKKVFPPEVMETMRTSASWDQSGHYISYQAVKKLGGWEVSFCNYISLPSAEEAEMRKKPALDAGIVEMPWLKDQTKLFQAGSKIIVAKRLSKDQALFRLQREENKMLEDIRDRELKSLSIPHPAHYSNINLTLIEARPVQTEWINEFISYGAEKNDKGNWNIFSCAFYPKSTLTPRQLQHTDWYMPKTRDIVVKGEAIECVWTKQVSGESMTKMEALQFLWDAEMMRIREGEKNAAHIKARKAFAALKS